MQIDILALKYSWEYYFFENETNFSLIILQWNKILKFFLKFFSKFF